MRHSEFASALDEFSEIVGSAHVSTDARELRAAETCTYATDHGVPAIVRPADRTQVQECVRAANRCGVALYPISSGKNWGYGSRVPAADGCVLLAVSGMNRI